MKPPLPSGETTISDGCGLRSTGWSLKLINRGERNTNSRISVTITSYWIVPRSCDHKMKLLMVRQKLLTGSDGVAVGAGFNSALSSLILDPSIESLDASGLS